MSARKLTSLTLVWLTPNQMWAFVLGEALVRLAAKDGKNGPMFFPTHGSAVEAARMLGLTVSKRNGKVSVTP